MKLKTIPAVTRSLALLEYLSKNRIAKFKDFVPLLKNISHASLSRLLEGLIALGYIGKRNGSYMLTKGIHSGFSTGHEQIVDLHKDELHDIVERLALKLLLPAGLFGMLGRMTMRIADSYNIGESPRFAPTGREHLLYPVHGFAKIFLAYADDDVRREMYSHLSGMVYNRKPEFDAFTDSLAAIRKNGSCIEETEWQPHVVRYTVPVFACGDAGKPIFALGVIGLPETISRKEDIIAAVLAAKKEMEAVIGDRQGGHP